MAEAAETTPLPASSIASPLPLSEPTADVASVPSPSIASPDRIRRDSITPPPPALTKSQSSANLHLLPGESIVACIKKCCNLASPGDLGDFYFTNYHFLFKPLKQHVKETRIVSASVERIKVSTIEKRNMAPEGMTQLLELWIKPLRYEAFAFDSSNSAGAIQARLHALIPATVEQLVGVAAAAKQPNPPCDSIFDGMKEYERQGCFNPNSNWRVLTLNADYSLCETYPCVLVVPKRATDPMVKKAAAFRSRGRFTTLSYKHHNHSSISRSAQPLVGMAQARSLEDEQLVQMIRETNPSQQLCIADARPMTNAMANKALNGAGFEGANYLGCTFQFLGIPNIHTTRDSHKKLLKACMAPDDAHFWGNVESSNWLDYLRLILSSSVMIAKKMECEQISVLVHCSDGWDRTAQLSSLAMLMLDPFYRTLEGFETLVEKEWVSFGHKFAERAGHLSHSESTERAPVFLQFIECVQWLTQQFPCAFEFNSRFLIAVIDGLYSCQYGTFLANCEKEAAHLRKRTGSFWKSLRATPRVYTNILYNGYDNYRHDILFPAVCVARCPLWTDFYLRHSPQYAGAHLYTDDKLEWDADTRGAQLLAELEQCKLEKQEKQAAATALAFRDSEAHKELMQSLTGTV